jgi:RNA polymerase sigma-70 factor (ECF subfamily)
MRRPFSPNVVRNGHTGGSPRHVGSSRPYGDGMPETASVAATSGQAEPPLASRLDQYRRELTAHCYRMLGSSFECEDAVQETMVRAWRSYDSFEGRSSLRSWLYRIATNVCLDMLGSRQRRARPMDFGAPQIAERATLTTRGEATWIEPIPDGRAVPDEDPAEAAVAKESIRLAFIGALQHLPPKQRAVLVLREVLRWKAEEVAELLDTSVASVNSALQRARATLGEQGLSISDVDAPRDDDEAELAARYAEAFERYDMASLTALLHDDATLSMPPYDLWLQGEREIVGWLVGPGEECRGSRLVPVAANGSPAWGQYRPSTSGSGHDPWALMVLESRDGKITGINSFLDTERLFPLFGLPAHLD